MKEMLKKYYLKNEDELKNLRRGDIINMVLEIDKSYNNFGKDELEKLIININEINNDIIEENQKLFDQLYNVIALDFFADLLYKKINQVDYRAEFKKCCLDSFNLKLFKTLKEKAPLTQIELAQELKMKPNALANRLAKLASTDFIYKYQIPSNKKSQYYALRDEYKNLIVEEKKVSIKPVTFKNITRNRGYSLSGTRMIVALSMKGETRDYEFGRFNKQNKY